MNPTETSAVLFECASLSRYDAMGLGGAMRRREFIAALGSTSALPLAALAQQVSLPRIGVLLVGLSPESKAAQHFRRGLRDAGYFEGRNVVIEWRYAQGDYGRVSTFVDEFIRNSVDVMVMDSTIGTETAKRATSTIPIVMALGPRPGRIWTSPKPLSSRR
jgi:putative tryptophan/tyrosine transport system substrate-binding protein